MDDRSKTRFPLIFCAALIVGLGVGAASVYLIGGFESNGQTELNASASAQKCEMNDEQYEALDAAATGALAAMRVAKEPVLLTNIGFQMPDGTKRQFADLNKVLLLNIWATWCGPCREEMPDLAALETQYGDAGFEVFALNVDRNGGAKPQQFLENINATALDLYLDPKNTSFQALRSKGLVFGLPTTMIVDPAGCVHGVLAGIANWGSDEARNLVEVSIQTLSEKNETDPTKTAY